MRKISKRNWKINRILQVFEWNDFIKFGRESERNRRNDKMIDRKEPQTRMKDSICLHVR